MTLAAEIITAQKKKIHTLCLVTLFACATAEELKIIYLFITHMAA